MPLYNIFHPVGAYTPEDKEQFANNIVDTYGRAIPRFYVGVLFHETAQDDFYMGGVAKDRFVRIRADHFARHMIEGDVNAVTGADDWMEKIGEAIAPFVRDRGYDWEIHYGETPRELWRISGIKPPEPNSAAEKLWIEQNHVSPF